MGDDLESPGWRDSPGAASQTELRLPKLRKGKKFKCRFDYGGELIHSVAVLGIFERSEGNRSYPRIVDKTGTRPPQYAYEERQPADFLRLLTFLRP